MFSKRFEKKAFKAAVKDNVKTLYRKTIDEATPQQLFQAVSYAVKDVIIDDWIETQKRYDETDAKTVYYMSMEFLMGRALGNNLINMTAYKDVKEALEEMNIDLNVIEDQEPDAALGNGGLGRLAACFLDSLATLNYPAYGCGIRYRYGMFKQKIKDGYQVEVPDNWLKEGNPFEVRREEYAKEVRFGGNIRFEKDPATGKDIFIQENYESVMAVPYDMPISGYGTNNIARLRLWKAQSPIALDMKLFSSGEYLKALEKHALAETISMVLYPEDNHREGQSLRLKQQYFLVSATLQDICAKHKAKYGTLENFAHKHVLHINDTHPTLVIPELMRILMDENDMSWEQAWNITSQSVAYTNHTVMPEALECWPVSLVQELMPRVMQIIYEINERFCKELWNYFPNDFQKISKLAIVADDTVRMAHLAIAGSFSINGVSALHSEILKERVFTDFYKIYSSKFCNVTNGIAHRRWLCEANPELAELIESKIGTGYRTHPSELQVLNNYADDKELLDKLGEIKRHNKQRLADYIKEHNGIEVNMDSIFDVQVKRLHEYKRQMLNILHIISLYHKLKDNPDMDFVPRTFIFGSKAAPGYAVAKKTIQLINSISNMIDNDPAVRDKLKVVFLEDYKVSLAEIIMPAAEVSEQISIAGKEASGTGNMKFMLNGALTLGTMDGANVEIVEEVGKENAFIFGLSAEQVIQYENYGGYNPMDIFNNDQDIRRVLMQLINGTFSNDTEMFRDIYNSLLDKRNMPRPDQYFILGDFRSYAEAQKRVEEAYKDEKRWAKMALLNTACAGKFTSDRTIQEYVDDIWHLDKVVVKEN